MSASYKVLEARRRRDENGPEIRTQESRTPSSTLSRIQELALVGGIFVLGMWAVLEVADRAIARQDRIMQETYN